ncbi:MAG: biofilm PGA synthesis N-glycosyltransferase PgaC [Sphingobacteriales bacterium]|jgi:biofilm PGA synthesis N-glycosyltransferase PgaC
MGLSSLEQLFWIALFIIGYTFVGFGLVAFIIGKFKTQNRPAVPADLELLPNISVVVAAFNEKHYIQDKIENTFGQSFPSHKIEMIVVADGSDDGTELVAEADPRVRSMYDPPRRGKTAALNRAIPTAQHDIILITDANAKVGGVSGEKSIVVRSEDDAASSGEGAYWKYESFLKKCDDQLHTLIGAPGEIFAFRKKWFSPIPEDTILDDFMLSMKIVLANQRLAYEPEAIAVEEASSDVQQEMKRKIRICSGGWQSMLRLPKAFFFTPNLWVSFIFISHRVLRWSLTPFLLFVVFGLNLLLMHLNGVYLTFMIAQVTFYFLVFIGYLFRNKKIAIKGLFVPYYFWIMNFSAILGLFRFLKGNQSAAWERSKRKLN